MQNVFPLTAIYPFNDNWIVAIMTKNGWFINTIHTFKHEAIKARQTLRGPAQC